MKIIKTNNHMLEFIVEDDEAENVASLFGKEVLIKLRSGDFINPKSITAIINPPLAPFVEVEGKYIPVLKDGQSIVNWAGNVVKINPTNIEYRVDPKYEKIRLALESGIKSLR